MAANQVGKTFAGGMEMAMHATGLYPDWYRGISFGHPTNCAALSNSHDTCRDICQAELFGIPEDPDDTGCIPDDLLLDSTSKSGVPGAFDTAFVRHVPTGGVSKIAFRAYEQDKKKHMGKKYHYVWPDEEPPMDVWSQYIRSILATGGIIGLTFTPELGVTGVVNKFMNDISAGMALVGATWEDAGHFQKDKERLAQLLDQIPEHERDMRSKGVPQMGSGLVFPITDEAIKCEPFKIPPYFRQMGGVDFGYDHPFAAARIAEDLDQDIIYIVNGYKQSYATPETHAGAIRNWNPKLPFAWPHDGMKHDPGSGKILANQYRAQGLNFLYPHFTNPPADGDEEGSGGIAVEPGLYEMYSRFKDGRLKVFENVAPFFEEKRLYHRKDGKVVAINDDFMSACRYAIMMRRFGAFAYIREVRETKRRGARNW